MSLKSKHLSLADVPPKIFTEMDLEAQFLELRSSASGMRQAELLADLQNTTRAGSHAPHLVRLTSASRCRIAPPIGAGRG